MKLKPAGLILGLAGNVALGWGLYHLLGIGSCGGEYPACPSSATPYFIALPVGIIVSVIAAFMGGAFFSFTGVFGAVGIASILRGINGGAGPEGDTTFPFVFGAFFLLPALLPVLAIPFVRRTARRKQALLETGKRGVATVTAVEDTGVTINNNPRVKIRLTVEPQDGSPSFEREKAMTVPRVDIPRQGDRYPVVYDDSQFELGQELPRPEVEGTITSVPVKQDWVTELGRLNDLRLQGALTDEEFVLAKEKLLSGDARAGADE